MNKVIMRRTIYTLIMGVTLLSCTRQGEKVVDVSVINALDSKILVYCEFPGWGETDNPSVQLIHEQENKAVSNITVAGMEGYQPNFFLWVYSQQDSSYCVLSNSYGNEIESYKRYNIVEGGYQIDHTKTKQTTGICDERISIKATIDRNLLAKMVKNTAITDSVFRLTKREME